MCSALDAGKARKPRRELLLFAFWDFFCWLSPFFTLLHAPHKYVDINQRPEYGLGFCLKASGCLKAKQFSQNHNTTTKHKISIYKGWLKMISIKTSKIICACLAVIGLTSVIAPASATIFSIDEFTVARGDGTVIFKDSFDGGGAPPSAPNFISNGNPASYFLTGAAGIEAGGSYGLDTSIGAVRDAVSRPGQNLVVDARLQTNVDNANNSNGLKGGNTFIVSGLFNLASLPVVPREGYGVRLSDSSVVGGTGNDILDIFLRQNSSGVLVIEFRRVDLVADFITSYGTFAYDLGHDQVLLQLSKLDTATKAIQASFAYVDSGVTGAFTTFGTTADIFNGENATRASFRATSPIPLPPTIFLSLIGLAALVSVRKFKA